MIKQANQHLQSLAVAVEVMRNQRSLAVSTEGVLLDMLNNVNVRAKNFFANIFDIKVGSTPLSHIKAVFASNPNTFKHLSVTDFVALSRVKVQTMEGFTGNYSEYAKLVLATLGTSRDTMIRTALDTEMSHYKTLLACVISNKADQTSWQDLTPRYTALAAKRKALDDAMAVYWREGSFESVTTIGDHVGNMQELNDLLCSPDCYAEKIKGALNAIDVQYYKNRVTEIGDLTKILDERLKGDNKLPLSSAQVTNLSEGIHELALQVEQFAVTLYRAHTFLTALTNLDKAVDNYK